MMLYYYFERKPSLRPGQLNFDLLLTKGGSIYKDINKKYQI